MFRVLLSLVIAMFVPLLIIPYFIKIQRKYKIGQRIRQEGPNLHQHKSGTPTMGGLIIFISVAISLLFYQPEDTNTYVAFILLCGFGMIGFIDDLVKFYKERSLGLKARVKVLIQLVICILFLLWMFYYQEFNQSIIIPFIKTQLFIPYILYIPFVILVFISSSNAVNLTDGLDGLATGLMIIALAAFFMIAFYQGKRDLAVLSLIIISSCIGFLVFNFHPAKIFLGDIGSLGLGGVLAAMAILTDTELFLLLIGGVFVIETLSVIIQVSFIHMNRKPLFKMSPLHHHFELSGWKEKKIVLLFWGIGIICSLLGLIAYPFY